MDTHSKSGSYLPVLGAILGGVGLIVGIVGAVQASKAGRELTELRTSFEQRISDAESAATSANGRADQAVKAAESTRQRLDGVVQQTMKAFEDVGTNFTQIRADMTKLASASAAPRASNASSAGGAAPGTLSADGSYVIKSGDTFSKLAAQFKVSVAELTKANPNVDPSKLKIGQKIKVPAAPKAN